MTRLCITLDALVDDVFSEDDYLDSDELDQDIGLIDAIEEGII